MCLSLSQIRKKKLYKKKLSIHTTFPVFTTMTNSVVSFHSLYYQPPGNSVPVSVSGKSKHFDTNAITIVAVLLCTVIFSLVLNSVIRCMLRSSIFTSNLRGSSSSSNGEAPSGGVKKKTLESMLTLTYTDGTKLTGSECAICLSEFAVGDRVRILPKCNHGFHVGCIDKWLEGHSSCPTCRRCLQSPNGNYYHPNAAVINPLDREDPFVNYRV